MDATANRCGVPAKRTVFQPSATVRRDRNEADTRRADAGPCRPYLGDARRRHPAGDRRQARQGNGRAVPRHATGDLVEPADLGNLRGNAAPHRSIVEKPGRRRRKSRGGRRRLARTLPHDLGRWRAGAAGAGGQAAGDRQGRAGGHGRKPAGPLRNRRWGLRPQSAADRYRPHAGDQAANIGSSPDRALCIRRVARLEGAVAGGSPDIHGARRPDRAVADRRVRPPPQDKPQDDWWRRRSDDGAGRRLVAAGFPAASVGAGRQAGRRTGDRGDFADAARLRHHRRPRDRFDQPGRARRPVEIPGREDGA